MKRWKDAGIDWSIFSRSRSAVYGIAILTIMLFHFTNDLRNHIGTLSGIWKFYRTYISSCGVEMFVFLSGAGLFFSMSKNPDVRQFYDRRIRRIAFPYVIVVLPELIFRDMILRGQTIVRVLGDFFFVTMFTDKMISYWYIAFIVAAYLLYPLFFFGMKKMNERLCLAIFLSASVLLQLGVKFVLPDYYENVELMLCRFFVFFLGAYCGKKIYEKAAFTWGDMLFLLIGGVMKLIYNFPVKTETIRTIRRLVRMISTRYIGCFYAITLVFILSLILAYVHKGIIIRILNCLGYASLEIYLTHVAFRTIITNIGLPVWRIRYALLWALLSFATSYLIVRLHQWISRNAHGSKQ